MSEDIVFISYAREDASAAERIYMDLRRNSVNAWLDTKNLLPGQDWNREIRIAVKQAKFFIAVLSSRSVSKRGVVQREIRLALEVLRDVPPGEIFVIPVRLDDVQPTHEQLNELNWVDMFPSYRKGMDRMMSVLGEVRNAPLELGSKVEKNTKRTPIEYTPFRSFSSYVDDFILKLPAASMYADSEFAIFIEYDTTVDGVKLPDKLRVKYPKDIQIVLQHQYSDLKSEDGIIFVRLVFGGKGENLEIPHSAVRHIAIPAIGVMLKNIG